MHGQEHIDAAHAQGPEKSALAKHVPIQHTILKSVCSSVAAHNYKGRLMNRLEEVETIAIV